MYIYMALYTLCVEYFGKLLVVQFSSFVYMYAVYTLNITV